MYAKITTMKFYSICETMTEEAAKLPSDKNIKLFMRHSIRYDNPVNGDYSNLLLTPEGIEIANNIGKSIDMPIGRFYSSSVERCKQTAREVARGAGLDTDIEECPEYTMLVGMDYASKVLGTGWYPYFYALQRGDLGPTGGVSLRDEAIPVIDRIFSDKGKDGTLDIICSHDCHVVILASALFDLKTGMNGENWCRYTEGLFLYGTRDDFTAAWRGEFREFKNFWL